MKVAFGRSVLIAALLILPSSALSGKAVLLVARETSSDMDFMIEHEVTPIITGLTEAGFSVVVASQKGKDIVDGEAVLKVQMRLADVNIDDYIAVVVPCMAAGSMEGQVTPDMMVVVKQAVSRGLPIAAPHSAILLLWGAGALSGKKYAADSGQRGIAADGTYVGTGVMLDRNLITSGTCPYTAAHYRSSDGTAEILALLIPLLKK